jgi:penicillin-binding protein-related factor A (putative recombinase)
MSNPTFQIAKSKQEEHVKFLINQCLMEFQEEWKQKIASIEIELIDLSSLNTPQAMVRNVKILMVDPNDVKLTSR